MFNIVGLDLAIFTSDNEADQLSMILCSKVLQNPFPCSVAHSPDRGRRGITLLCLNPILILVFYPRWMPGQVDEIWFVRSAFLTLWFPNTFR